MGLLELNRKGSDFVNITAWLTMALTLGWFVMSLFYLGIYVIWLPRAEIDEVVQLLVDDGMLPLAIPWFLDHLVQYFVSAIVFAPFLFYSAVDLLRRKEWARVFIVAMIVLSAVANVVPIVGLAAYPEYLFPPIALAEDPLYLMRYMMTFLIVVLSVLLVALAVKFQSAAIKAEFARPSV